jgi:hypothetical protein
MTKTNPFSGSATNTTKTTDRSDERSEGPDAALELEMAKTNPFSGFGFLRSLRLLLSLELEMARTNPFSGATTETTMRIERSGRLRFREGECLTPDGDQDSEASVY